MAAPPSPDVLDRFAVPTVTSRLAGGQGGSVLAGDLALSPHRDRDLHTWLSPLLARLAYELDLAPGRRPLRLAMPVPARDGEWVVAGWAATRYEPDTTPCHDLDVLLATARLLHARFAAMVPQRPPLRADLANRWDSAEAVAFGEATAPDVGVAAAAVAPVLAELRDTWLGPDQLVHRDLASNVLIDPRGSALVIDVSPAWRPVLWAEAVCVLDGVTWQGGPRAALEPWRTGRHRQAMLRALIFRMLSDRPLAAAAYAPALDAVLPAGT